MPVDKMKIETIKKAKVRAKKEAQVDDELTNLKEYLANIRKDDLVIQNPLFIGAVGLIVLFLIRHFIG